ncbi:glycoside hydrolase family 10 protein [Flagellimonas allohymeniacidonis]|uniref:Glycosyl hydrolase n=1 Tax=Flagellimonas allohymeniacidonis TaxID=2517819 RepID=A0A4Q8QHM6_9FLAO|nr:family 10 glycosylhydrolase [Allomuricauda hymeniacidonis]TAI49287.1 glycosyl hydrolase [Allomuricauda hymeniacidonis]
MKYILGSILLFLVASCAVTKYQKTTPEEEFRGVWIATVVNIDWPKNGKDNTEKQKKDFIEILDFYQKLNFNAAIVQIRTAGDALYPTDLAPWSKYLTGKEGTAPKNFDDPLVWMIQETHKRGMEFHAWLNPYRATFDLDTLALASSHDFYQHPDWMVKYGKKYYYNPGLPEVQDKFSRVVGEIVSKYQVDAIHFDDYFYPYKIEGETFDDALAFQTYGLPNQNIEDWRRSNVDSLVKKVHSTIKRTKPWVQFGISPFGVWKNKSTDPNGSDTQAGQTTFEDLYADPLLWAKKGWLDYLAPQAYWSMEYPRASHRKITQWWADTLQTTNLYIGNGPYKIKNNADKAWNKNNEIPKQLLLARNINGIKGNVFFSAKSLIGKHEKVVRKLRKIYALPTKNPALPIRNQRNIGLPTISSHSLKNNQLEFCISHSDTLPRFTLYYLLKDTSRPKQKTLIGKSYLSGDQSSLCDVISISKKQAKQTLGVSIIDAYGNESELQILNKN